MTTVEIVIQLRAERSMERAREERNTFFVKNLLQSNDFADEKIATLVGVSLEFVQEVKQLQ